MGLTELGRRMIGEHELQRLRQENEGGYRCYGRGGPSDFQVRRLLEHQCWLNSDGKTSDRLEVDGKFRGRGGRRLNFIEADLSGVAFSKAVLSNITFAFSNLKYARFDGAQFRNVRFIGCDLEEANFTGATLDEVSFEEGTNYQKARFGQTDLRRVYWDMLPRFAVVMDSSPRLDL